MGSEWDGRNDGMSLVHHWESLETDLEGSLLPPRAQVRVKLGEEESTRTHTHTYVQNFSSQRTMKV